MEQMVKICDIDVKSLLTKSNLPVSDYSVNPYVGCTHACKYCYASFMKRFTNHPEPWGEFLDVKHWPEITNSHKYDGKELFIGSVTDPYNPQEEEYGRTRALLQQLKGSSAKISIQTKSDLVLRDMDLISTFPDARVGFSINTLDECFKEDMDKVVSIKRRLEAMRRFHEAGIRTTCFISPIFPGKHSELLPLYEEIYLKNKRTYWELLDAEVRAYAGENGLEYLRNDDTMKRPFDAPPVIVNFFYHEEIKKSAVEGGATNA